VQKKTTAWSAQITISTLRLLSTLHSPSIYGFKGLLGLGLGLGLRLGLRLGSCYYYYLIGFNLRRVYYIRVKTSIQSALNRFHFFSRDSFSIEV
jgi:hypothetical protein